MKEMQHPLKLFLSNALPVTMGMILTSGVVVVDGLFVGRFVGAEALAAVGLTTPVVYALMALAIMLGVGGMAVAVPLLGSGKPREAARIRSATLFALVLGIVLLTVGIYLGREPLLRLLGARGTLLAFGRDYLSVMVLCYPPMMLSIGFMIFLRGSGDPLGALKIGVTANAVNILLDWFFIARLGLGLGGAAAASTLASLLSCILSGLLFLSRGRRGMEAYLPAKPRFLKGELGFILANGSSELIGQLAAMLTIWLFNRSALALFGPAGVAAASVMGYLAFIETMTVSGAAIGLVPVVGRAWGAGDPETGSIVRAIAARAATICGIFCYLLALAAGRSITGAWTGGDHATMAIAESAFVLYALTFLFNGYNYVASAFLTAVQDARGSATVALLRGLLLPVPLLVALPALFGALGLWLALPVSELITVVVATSLTRRGLVKLNAGFRQEMEVA